MKENKLFSKLNKRWLALVLSIAILIGLFSSFAFEDDTQAAFTSNTITLVQAKKLAIANSPTIEKIEIQIDAKRAALSSAIKSIKVKKKNMSTFRWTPLLKFKFPTQPDLSEAYEFQYKPIQIQYDIDKLNHKLVDARLAEYEKVVNLYVDIVVYEKRIAFNTSRAELMEENIHKNTIKLAAGDATPSDIDTMQKAYDKAVQSISSDSSALIAAKKKMSNILKIDVTSGYKFLDPFIESSLERDLLPALIQYTMDRDDAYYDLCIDETAGRISTQTNYNLLNGHYSRKYMNAIAPYIKAALAGEDFNTKAFYNNYKWFVNTVNEKWNGKKRILFFKFKKSWFQGDLDGDRYIEDDPYSAYSSVLDYVDARKAREQGAEELAASVEESFNQYISIRNSYQSYSKQVETAEINLEDARKLNAIGDLTYNEFKAVLDEYEELQNSLFDSMKEYTQTLISFDRRTCGGVSAYLGDLIGDLGAVGGGESYVEAEYLDGAYYYIRPIIQSEQFELGVSFADDFELSITDFELWIDNVQVGTRTPVESVIRHHAFDLDGVTKAFIRFYDEDEFIDDVEIDPLSEGGELKIVVGYNRIDNNEIGEYVLAYSDIRNQYTLTLTMNKSEDIGFYRVKDASGAYLISDKQREITNPLVYLNTINASMGLLEFEFFDKSGTKLYDATVDTTLMKIYKKDEKVEE